MTNFAIFAFIWPVVGTFLVIGFALFLARRTRALYERAQAGERQASYRAVVANSEQQPSPQRAEA